MSGILSYEEIMGGKNNKPAPSKGQASSIPSYDEIMGTPAPRSNWNTLKDLMDNVLSVTGLNPFHSAEENEEKKLKLQSAMADSQTAGAGFIGSAGTAISDFGNMFSKVNMSKDLTEQVDRWKKKMSDFKDNPVDFVSTQLQETMCAAGELVTGLPLGVLSLVTAPTQAASGVDFSNLRPLNDQQRADEIKMTVANTLAIAAGAGVNALIGKSALAGVSAELGVASKVGSSIAADASLAETGLANVSTQTLMKTAVAEPFVGALGRRILADAASGLAAGVVQGAVAGANKDDVIAQMALNGIVFAGLGAGVGYLHGLKDIKKGYVAPPEQLRATAGEVARTRSVQASTDLSLDQIVNNTSALVESNNLAEAIANGRLKTNPGAIGILRDLDEAPTSNDKVRFSSYQRPDGKFDAIWTGAKEAELFPGRQMPLKDKTTVKPMRDLKGNIIPMPGDAVVATSADGGRIQRGIVDYKDGEIIIRKTHMETLDGPPVENAEGGIEPRASTRTEFGPNVYAKYNPNVWYVDPEQVKARVITQTSALPKATPAELDVVHNLFSKTGELPQIGTIGKNARQLVSFEGQDFFVEKVEKGNNTYTLTSPKGQKIIVRGDEIRVREPQLYTPQPKELLDQIYQSMENRWDKEKSFDQNVASVAAEYGLKDDNWKPLRNEMADRMRVKLENDRFPDLKTKLQYETAVRFLDEEHMAAQVDAMNDAQAAAYKLGQSASRNGMYIERHPTGIAVRNAEDGAKLWEGNKLSDAQDFVNESGQLAGIDFTDVAHLPADQLAGGTPAHVGNSIHPLLDGVTSSRGGWSDKMRTKLQHFDRHVPWLSSMRAFIAAVDEPFGLNLQLGYDRLSRSSLKTKAAIDKANGKYKPLMDEHDKLYPGARADLFSQLRETMSPPEIIAQLFKDRPLGNSEISVAKLIAEKNIDETLTLQYRTRFNDLRAKYKAEATVKLNELSKLAGKVSDEDMLKSMKALQNIDANPKYIVELEQLNDSFKSQGFGPNEAELFKKLEGIAVGGMNEASIYGAVRLGRAWKNQAVHGLSRTEFAAKHGFNANDIKMAEKFDAAYEEMGNEFMVPDSRRINGYMNHMRSIGMEGDPNAIMQFSKHLENPNVARFMSSMGRTSELAEYVANTGDALRGYIRGGYKAKILFNDIYTQGMGDNAIMGVKEAWENELAKISSPQIKEIIQNRLNEYVEGLSGRLPIETQAAHDATNEMIRRMTLENMKKSKVATKDGLSLVMNLNQSAFMGGRPILGLRDLIDVSKKYFIHFGTARLGRFLKQVVTPKNLTDLIDRGIIKTVDKHSFTIPTEEGAVYQGARQSLEQINNLLFKMTLQDKVYVHAQAAAFYESKSTANALMKEYLATANKKEGAEKLISGLALRRFEDNVANKITHLLEVRGSEAASNYYGTQVARRVAGLYGNMEQPSKWNTKSGRVFGALGQYSVDSRRFAQDMATRGTRKEIAGAMTRYLIGESATLAAGRLAGIDVGRWLMTPASLLFGGGPLMQFVGNLSNFGQTAFSDQAKQRYTYNDLATSFPKMFIPGAYFASDIHKGMVLLNQEDDARGWAQMVGLPASTDDEDSSIVPYFLQKMTQPDGMLGSERNSIP